MAQASKNTVTAPLAPAWDGQVHGPGVISVPARIMITWSAPVCSSILTSARRGRSSTSPPPRCSPVVFIPRRPG
jgi:hypothetical protein